MNSHPAITRMALDLIDVRKKEVDKKDNFRVCTNCKNTYEIRYMKMYYYKRIQVNRDTQAKKWICDECNSRLRKV